MLCTTDGRHHKHRPSASPNMRVECSAALEGECKQDLAAYVLDSDAWRLVGLGGGSVGRGLAGPGRIGQGGL